jgi:hypothetical protein
MFALDIGAGILPTGRGITVKDLLAVGPDDRAAAARSPSPQPAKGWAWAKMKSIWIGAFHAQSSKFGIAH